MKTNKILVVAMMLAMAGATFTSCSKNDDEKMAEIVDDPIKATTEYYINGLVVDKENKAIEGVTVSTDGQSVKTDAKGNFTLTVKNIGTYTVSASMDGYLKAKDMNVTIPNDATNRSSFNTSFILNKKVTPVAIPEDNTEDVVISTASNSNVGDMGNVESGLAIGIPAGNEGLAGSKIAVSEYVEQETGNSGKNEAAVSRVYIDSSNDISAKGVTMAVANPVKDGGPTFNLLKVYKNNGSSRSGEDDEELMGEALMNNGKYEVTLEKGNLAGDYSFKIDYSSSTTNGKETQSGKIDNSSSLNAMKDCKIPYTEKSGTIIYSMDSVEGELKNMIENSVKSCEGAISSELSSTDKTLTTNVSGNHILYYTIENNYTETSYTYTLTGGKTVTTKVKTYTGTTVKYQIESADKHSGGTADGE